MKVAKILAYVLGGIVVLVLVLGAIALMPGVQTWAVKKAVANQPGMKIEVGRVAAGFSAADIRDLRVVKDGMVITAKGVTANYSAWDYLKRKRINADQVAVEELLVDLRAATPAPGANGTPAKPNTGTANDPSRPGAKPGEPPAGFNGVLSQIQIPFDVRVAKLTAKGRALLPKDQTVVFELQGSGIETGQRGKLDLKADFTDATPGAPLTALHLTGTTGVMLTADHRVSLVEFDLITAAEGPKLPTDRIKLEGKAEQLAAGADEGYTATIAILRGNRVEPLLKTAAQYSAKAREFTGAWDLNVRSEQLAAVLAGFGLPELAAAGGGKFSFKPDTGAVTASGDLQGSASRLEKIAAELATIGAMNFRATFDGGMAENAARLERLQLDVTASDGRKLAQVTTAQRVGFSLTDKRVTLANPQAELARITLQALPLAWAQPFVKNLTIDSGDLSLALAVEAEADGSRIRARATEPVSIRALTLRSGDKKLVEQLTFAANPRVDYSATRVVAELADLKIALPAGDAITGLMSADITNLSTKPAIAFSSQIQAKLVKAHEAYSPIKTGPLAIESSTQGKLEGDVLQIAKSSTTINREGGALLTAIELLQTVTLNLKASTFTSPNPTATLARVRLGEVPLAWAEPFVAKSKLAGSLAGATLEISSRSLEDITINTAEPLALRGVSVAMDGKPMLQSVDLSANLTGTKRGDTIVYEVRRAEIKQGNVLLAGIVVAGEAKLGAKLVATAKGNLEADAAALMQQPVAASFATLSRGKVTSTFDAALSDTIQAKATLTARGLVAKQNNQTLGDLDVSLTANMKADGSGTIIAPITMTNGARKSDVAVDGAFGKSTDQKSFLFTGRIASNQIFVDDFQPLTAIAPASKPTDEKPAPNVTVVRAPTPQTPGTRPGATPPTTAPRGTGTTAGTTVPAKRDTQPFWAGVQGKVAVDMKRIVYGKDYTITGVRGNAVITDSKLSLDGLEGSFKGNPFKLAGGVTFAGQQPQPYALIASADVQNLDIGEILRAANPNEKPAFETKATLVARVNGNGGNIGDLMKNAFGKFELSGAQGVTRLLAKRGGASTAVNVASGVLAILGATQKNEGTANALNASSELIRLFNEIRFDSVKLQVERGQDLSFKLTSIEILSPLLRASGSGTVASKSTDDIANAPMNIALQLGAKGELAYALQRAKQLGDKQDEKGYALMSRNFTIGGTPSKPDNAALWSMLLETGLGAFGR